MRAVTEVRVPSYVVNERMMEGLRLIESVLLYLDRPFIFFPSLFYSPVKTDVD